MPFVNPDPVEPQDAPRDEAELVRRIAGLRVALRAYVLSILPHKAACDDVVQETMIFLWERRGEYREDTNLRAWAFKVAWFKAMGHRRDRMREERIVCYSEEALHRLGGAMEEILEHSDERMEALRMCLSQLDEEEVRLLRLKYVDRASLTDYALGRAENPNRFLKAISRLRLRLRHCIESKLSLS
ncbi:MAG: sigma-70 family RNA polymerase sigma factor [Luteolibacter sp.]